MVAHDPTWTDERVALLKQLFERGRTCREIAYEIGLSRNAVIGKISRMKLTRPTSRGRRSSLPRDAAPRTRRPSGARQLQILLAAKVGAPVAEAILEEGPGCTLLELGNETCRWPLGAADAPLMFCGNPVLGGLSYCAGHARLAYRVTPRRMLRSGT